MSFPRWFLVVMLVLAAVAVLAPGSLTTATDTADQKLKLKPKKQQPKTDGEEIIQEFPGAEGEKTSWKVHYQIGSPRPGLLITGAWFKTSPSAEWFQVLGETRLSEIFVPYNNGTTRIYDIGAQGDYGLLSHTEADAGVNGSLLHNGLLVKEMRDTGILWKYYEKVRRGQELVLWATISAANYNYLVEFSFRCDGTITCKLGSTGKNYGNHETMGHMHHGCWRIDLNVGEKDQNNVAVVKRVETKAGKGRADETATFLKKEGGIVWKAEEFTRLRVESKLKNGQDHLVSYDLLPLRPGTPRHFGQGEEFTNYDFWVTPYKFDELYYGNLPTYAKPGRSIANTDVVVWYMSPAYHLPRDEDGLFINGRGDVEVRGVAMTTWCGLEMRPRNLFDKSPLYP